MPGWMNAVIGTVAGALIATLIGIIKGLWGRQKAQAARQENVEKLCMAIAHDRLFYIYADLNQKGYATVDEIRNVEYLYEPYHKLGGNGTGTELYERITKMQTEPLQAAKEEKS